MLLTSGMLYIDAKTGRIAAMLTLVLGFLPGVCSLGALRFEMVRLLIREVSVVFFVLLNAVTHVMTVILLSDLRGLYLANFSIGFMNVVSIDARLRSIRTFTFVCTVSVLVVVACLLALMRGRVDKVNDLILWQYQDGCTVYNVCVSEYITTRLFTLLILLLKILYRKLRSVRTVSNAHVIECTMFQCQTRLVVSSQNPSTASVPPRDMIKSTPNSVQQLQFLCSMRMYDCRKVVFPMAFYLNLKPFPLLFLVVLYGLGATGFVLFLTSSLYGNTNDETSSDITVSAAVMLTSSLAIWLVFVTCYQRDLLRSLAYSFDFLFYSFQVTTLNFASACLGQWEKNRCIWLLTSWIWAHWFFCMDALTPVMRAKLRFHVRYAAPIVAMQLLGGVKLLIEVMTQRQRVPENSVLWVGQVFGYDARLHLLPFLINRMLLTCTWTLRLLLRLCRSSNADLIILRGTVSFENNTLSQSTNHTIKPRIANHNAKRAGTRIVTAVLRQAPSIHPASSISLGVRAQFNSLT